MARLRANLETNDIQHNLGVITGSAEGDSGIPNGDVLIAFSDAAIGEDKERLAEARERVIDAMGAEACVDAAGVIATFNAMDRIADATGVPLEDWKLEASEDFREAIGIEAYREGHID